MSKFVYISYLNCSKIWLNVSRDHNSSYNTKMTLNFIFFIFFKNTYHRAPMEIIFFLSNIAHYIHSRPLPAHYYHMKNGHKLWISCSPMKYSISFYLFCYLRNVPIGIMFCTVAKLWCFFFFFCVFHF